MNPSLIERLHIGEKTKEIKTLIFDFGGVLLNLNKERSIKNFEKLGIEGVHELLSFWCQKGVFLLFEEGKISTEDFFREIKAMSSREITEEEIKKAFFSFLVDLPKYKLDLIERLRQHYTIYLLSNINALVYDYCVRTYIHPHGKTMEDYFDKQYLSFQMNVCKPNKKIYEMMLEDTKIRPEETLFLEDGEQNTLVAQSLGINTFLVLPSEDFSSLFELPLLKR